MENKNYILVVGGNGLIGAAVVEELLNSSFSVISVDLSSGEKEHPNLISKVFDVSNTSSIQTFLDELTTSYLIDGMVNASFPRGKGWKKDAHNINHDEFADNINVHLNSYSLFTYYFAQICSRNSVEASIVNIASIFGVVSPPIHLYDWEDAYPAIPYPAIKGGIISFSRFVAGKFGKKNIRVNCVSPGVVMGSKMEGKSDFIEGMKKNMLCRTAKPIEVAQPIKFLLSKESSFITGQNLIIDGGWTNM